MYNMGSRLSILTPRKDIPIIKIVLVMNWIILNPFTFSGP
tara:strand:+ start:892 stop:1011 length:120 start_codon:yes stop_codon:yes gene_type:complete